MLLKCLLCVIGLWICKFTSTESSCPSNNQLPCDDGKQCINRTTWCNSENDCDDHSDEQYCKKRHLFNQHPNKCTEIHFLCKTDRICIPKSATCDGFKDCPDETDEDYCVYSVSQGSSSSSSSSSSEEEGDGSGKEKEDQDVRREDKILFREHPAISTTVSTALQATTKFFEGRGSSGLTATKRYNVVVSRGVKWLLSMHDANTGWGRQTPRAIVALALARPNLFAEPNDKGALMKKQLDVSLLVDLFRNGRRVLSASRLSLYINALLVTCQDPRHFFGIDLVENLKERMEAPITHPIAHLTLCLAKQSTLRDYHNLQPFNARQKHNSGFLHTQDMTSLSIIAKSCMVNNYEFAQTYANSLLKEAEVFRDLISTGNGSFHNLYSTALAVQALQSVRNLSWKPEPFLNYLSSRQLDNGSFGDVLATYYVLPTLLRKSLLSINRLPCWSSEDNGLTSLKDLLDSHRAQIGVHYALEFEDSVRDQYALNLKVPVGTNFFDVMRIAQQIDPSFRFLYEERDSRTEVYSVGGIPNDAERGLYWQLNVLTDKKNWVTYLADIKKLIVKEEMHHFRYSLTSPASRHRHNANK